MEEKGWNYMVKTRCENFQHLENGDIVLDTESNTVWPVASTDSTALSVALTTLVM